MIRLLKTILPMAAIPALFAGVLLGTLWNRTLGRREPAAMRGGDVIPPSQVLRREDVARRVAPVEGREPIDAANLRQALKTGKTYDVLLKGAITGPLAPQNGSPEPRSLICVFEMQASRTVEANVNGRFVEARRFGTFHMVKWTTGASEAELELGRPGESILAPLIDRCSPAHSVEIPASLAADLLVRGGRSVGGDASLGRAWLCAVPLSGKTVRLTRAAGIGTESIEPIGCSLSGWEAELLFDSLAATHRNDSPADRPAPGAASPGVIVQLGELLLPVLRAALLQCEVLELQPGGAWDVEGRTAPPTKRSPLTLYFTDATGYPLGHWVALGELGVDEEEKVLKTARLTGEFSFCEVRQQAFLFDEMLADPAELSVCFSCDVH